MFGIPLRLTLMVNMLLVTFKVNNVEASFKTGQCRSPWQYGTQQSARQVGYGTVYNQWTHPSEQNELPLLPRFGYAAAKLSFESSKHSKLHPEVTELLVLNGGSVSCSSSTAYSPCGVSDETTFLSLATRDSSRLHIRIDQTSGKPGPRFLHTAVSFPELLRGPVVFYGGANPDETALREVWYLEQATDGQGLRWRKGPLGPPRYGHSAVKYGSAMVTFGGCNGSVCFNDIYTYDVVNEKWKLLSATGSVPSPRMGHAALFVLGYTPRMLVHGGMSTFYSASPEVYGDTYLFDANFQVWTLLSVSPVASSVTIAHAASVFFVENQYYGYWMLFGTVFSSKQLPSVNASTFSLQVRLDSSAWPHDWVVYNATDFVYYPESRWMTHIVSFSTVGRQVGYMIGGSHDVLVDNKPFFDPLGDIWSINEQDGFYTWVPVCPLVNGPETRAGHTAVQLQGSQMYIFGGVTRKLASLVVFAKSDVWSLEFEAQEVLWQRYAPTASKVYGVVGHVAVGAKLKGNVSNNLEEGFNILLAFGGFLLTDTRPSGELKLTNNIIAIAPTLLVWAVLLEPNTRDMPLPRAYHSGVLYRSTVYIYGGMADTNYTSLVLDDIWSWQWNGTVENPPVWELISNGSFATPGSRFGHSAVIAYDSILGEDVMLVFGGTNWAVAFADLWMFVFSQKKWQIMLPSQASLEPSFKTGLFGHTANMVGQKMIVYGGCQGAPKHFISQDIPVPECPHDAISGRIVYFDTKLRKWTEIDQGSKAVPLYFHTSLYANEVLNVYGGFSENLTMYSQVSTLSLGCNAGYYGSFLNESCSECPMGTYSSEGGPGCTPCNNEFTTGTVGSKMAEDCNKCAQTVDCVHGHCYVTLPNQIYKCTCNFFYTGRHCSEVEGSRIGLVASVCVVVILVIAVSYKCRKVRSQLKNYKKAFGDVGSLSSFALKSSIGSDSYGTVYRATDSSSSPPRAVAVKIVKESKTLRNAWKRSNLNKEFGDEVEYLRNVTGSSNIVVCHGGGVFEEDECWKYYLVSELIFPGDLAKVLHEYPPYKRNVTLDLSIKIRFSRDAAQGIYFMQRYHKRFHLDIKTRKLLLNMEGAVKLTIFNTGRIFQQKRSRQPRTPEKKSVSTPEGRNGRR